MSMKPIDFDRRYGELDQVISAYLGQSADDEPDRPSLALRAYLRHTWHTRPWALSIAEQQLRAYANNPPGQLRQRLGEFYPGAGGDGGPVRPENGVLGYGLQLDDRAKARYFDPTFDQLAVQILQHGLPWMRRSRQAVIGDVGWEQATEAETTVMAVGWLRTAPNPQRRRSRPDSMPAGVRSSTCRSFRPPSAPRSPWNRRVPEVGGSATGDRRTQASRLRRPARPPVR
ncbi:hypothetical protein OG321_35455 [Streptomyces sp. NBC_00424]|uniref:hypothetical protein n=1 Tax=Streptomyces sp. NBC_00424 TaxID=2903648 RepID=UPI00225659E2|nr:hypothetical protein [Streptomyces sp. NBC_00424]MCX5077766.1 hypothetical protein [Streptomyces sp. NBC_00424]